jgi:hypothetical protein
MTKKEAVAEFHEIFPPEVFQYHGSLDKLARCEAWNNYTDLLCKDGKITLKQYETWTHPF